MEFDTAQETVVCHGDDVCHEIGRNQNVYVTASQIDASGVGNDGPVLDEQPVCSSLKGKPPGSVITQSISDRTVIIMVYACVDLRGGF